MLLISREYPPFVGGGIGTYTVRMARALAGLGRRVVVVTVGDTDRPTEEDDGPVPVVRLPFLDHDARGQADWSAPRASILASPSGPASHAAFWSFHRESVLAMQLRAHLPWLLERFSPEAIEAPDTGALLWFVLNERRLGRGPLAERGQDGPPVVVHLHSPTAWIEQLQGGPQPGRAAAELRSMERDVLRWADGVVCPSRALAEWAQRWEPTLRDRVQVVPYPLGRDQGLRSEPACPGPARGADADQTPPPLRALFVGRMERRKGLDTLARAVAMLGDKAPAVRVAGRDTIDWASGRWFGRHAMDEAGVAFELLGELDPSALAQARAQCAIAVVPSPDDNFPNTCMEAMDAGQVVVASRSGGMAEMIEDGVSGLLFAPGNARDLAQALERACAMTPGERQRMGQAAQARIAALCDDAAVVARRLEHLASIRPSMPQPMADRQVAVLANGSVEPQVRRALADALRANGSVDVVVPWFARVGPDGREVVVCSTPSQDRRELLVEHPGPLAMDAAWWQRLEDHGGAESPAHALAKLLELGARAAVLPEVVTGGIDQPGLERPGRPAVQRLSEAERAARHAQASLQEAQARAHAIEQARHELEAQLAEIRSSRAYRLAVRLSALRRRLLGGPLQ